MYIGKEKLKYFLKDEIKKVERKQYIFLKELVRDLFVLRNCLRQTWNLTREFKLITFAIV